MSSSDGASVVKEKANVLDFGTTIAFVAPGFLALIAASYHVTLADDWLTFAARPGEGVGVFLFVVLASLALGILVSGVRSIVFDWLYSKLGLPRPEMDYLALKDPGKKAVFDGLNENFYRYYQFYANSLVAVLTFCGSYMLPLYTKVVSGYAITFFVLLVIALFISARISLARYYEGLNILFGRHGGAKG